MGVIMRLLKKLFHKLFRREKEVPAGIEVFDEHGNIITDVTTTLTKIVWTRVLTEIVPTFTVEVPIYEGQHIFTLREFNPYPVIPYNPNHVSGGYRRIVNGNKVTFKLTNDELVGKTTDQKLLIGVY